MRSCRLTVRPALGTWTVLRILAIAVLALLVAGPLATPAAQARTYADIIVDAVTGEVLRSRSPDTQIYPASLTKMMTLYLLFESLQNGRLSIDSTLTASALAASQPATNLALHKGATLTVEQAIYALVIRSANDVAMVVAEELGGNEADFARLMTERARQLGMHNTVFRNPHGLPNKAQVSTAADMVTLARALMFDFPGFYHYFSATRFSYNGVTYKSHNRLMQRYAGADGLKTGYIRASGFNLAFSAVRDGRRLIGVVIGGASAASRDDQMAAIMDDAFDRAGPILMAAAPPPPPKPGSDMVGMALAAAGYTLPSIPLPEGNPTDLTIAQLAAGALPAPVPAEPVGQGDLGSSPTLNGIDAAIGAAPLPSAPAETSLTGIWGVQDGAFSKFAAAHSAALYASQRAAGELQNARIQIEEIRNELGTIYRARLIGLEEQGAHNACAQLRSLEQPCIVLKAGDIVAMN
ncbi:MAG: D-alanyl-D-alanine carboxypeptidase family protein [Dongiaceae bacterium]